MLILVVTACFSSVYLLLQLIGAQSPVADAGNHMLQFCVCVVAADRSTESRC